jgi:hypothetical protein
MGSLHPWRAAVNTARAPSPARPAEASPRTTLWRKMDATAARSPLPCAPLTRTISPQFSPASAKPR